MKRKFNNVHFFIIALAVLGIYACSDDSDLPNDGRPMIKYVRVTNPEASDSLLTSGAQGALIAIIGENLQDTREVWFNNLKAFLKPPYVSSTSIITNIPGKIPTDITNKLYLISSDGDTLTHEFTVDIGEPYIKSMRSEYVAEGGTAFINGDFFYEPITVTFTGGVEGMVSSIEDDKILKVVVPEGAQPGPITVETNFGETTSDFWFRDDRNIFVSSDPFKGYSGAEYVVTDPGEDAPRAINGNYIRINKIVGDYEWTPFAEGSPNDFGEEAKAIPDDAILHPGDYYLKFEINTQKPYNNNGIKFQLAMVDGIVDNRFAYKWEPPFDTQGKWETIALSLDEVLAGINPVLNESGYYVRFLVHGPGQLDADISFDNFRVVPKVLD